MRTTIDIRDDVLQAVREHAAIEHVGLGELLSRWAERRRYVAAPTLSDGEQNARQPRSGFRVPLKNEPKWLLRSMFAACWMRKAFSAARCLIRVC
jgi:hypothetical protein